MKKTIGILLFALMTAAAVTTAAQEAGPAAKPTTVILVRHAERDPGEDPPINEAGEIRAGSLVRVLEESGLTAIYVPDLIRNRQTAGPVAEALGITPAVIPDELNGNPKGMAEYLVNEIFTRHQGGVVLFIGNQSTSKMGQLGNLQEVYLALGGKGMPLTRYSDLYIFTFTDREHFHLIKAEYGNR